MPAPYTTDDYLALITSEHRGRPKFVSTVAETIAPYVETQAFLADLPAAFDIDTAVGVQLDAVGEWVGRSRYVNIPLVSVWFSWDTAGLGWEQGVWKGAYDPTTGVAALDDETYRLLLRAKIVANQWNSSIQGAQAALDVMFGMTGTLIFLEDHQDMTMTIGVAGLVPNALFLALLAGGYIPIKPSGVGVTYSVTTITETPIFGWDVESAHVSGWDVGSWGASPEYVMSH